ncbi:MAG: hypothetical protein ACE5F6_15545 [Anaerolineae bacterium]
MNIRWTPPEPRPGLAGAWDRFIGPGATPAENWLIVGSAVVGGLALPLYTIFKGLGWSPVQLVVAGLIAADLAGGVAANTASPAKRWYHRPGQGFTQHLTFVAVHVGYILLIAWLFHAPARSFFWGVFGYLIAASLITLASPLYLQRPVAALVYCGAILLNSYVLTPPAGWEWFVPLLFMKLVVGHLVKEAPFRPEPHAAAVSDARST